MSMMRCALIGEKLGHSFSPLIHKQFGLYDYELLPVAPDKLDELLKKGDFSGFNVTIPYKKAVMPYCSKLSEAARQIGCVNTLVRRADGTLYGDNTDCAGFLYLAKKAGISFKGKKVLILGSGATSLTVTAAVKMQGAREVVIVSRSGKVNYENIYEQQDAQILVNATPVGMYPNNGVNTVDLSRLHGLCGVLDVVYNPLKTALLLQAEKLGLPCGCGLSMLVAQAEFSAEQFCGKHIDEKRIDEIEGMLREQLTNLVIIGMPGSGKTTFSKLLAERMKREVVDIDEEIVKSAKMSVPEIFEKYGEARFRDLESEEIAKVGMRTGIIISTGGGAVLRQKNVDALRQNAVIVWLQRPIEALSTDGRPLSKSSEALHKMLEERTPYYQGASDFAVNNDSSIEEAVKKIAAGYYKIACDKQI